MRRLVISVILASSLMGPAHAADWQSQTVEVRPGTFIGARLTIGGRTGGRPSAALTVAPTQNRISNDGTTSMKVGEGIALNLKSGRRPTLTLVGIRADTALGLRRSGNLDADKKLGVSSGGWVAIGVGALALVAGGLYLAADHIADCDEGECD